jgi:hypothetical protein
VTSNSQTHDQGESLSPAPAMTTDLSLKKSGRRRDDYYDVLAGGVVVGRIMLFLDSPTESSWMWATALRITKGALRPMGMPSPERPQRRRSRKAGTANETRRLVGVGEVGKRWSEESARVSRTGSSITESAHFKVHAWCGSDWAEESMTK